jgi:hypothetical protein
MMRLGRRHGWTNHKQGDSSGDAEGDFTRFSIGDKFRKKCLYMCNSTTSPSTSRESRRSVPRSLCHFPTSTIRRSRRTLVIFNSVNIEYFPKIPFDSTSLSKRGVESSVRNLIMHIFA